MDNIWWEKIGGPRRFLAETAELLADGRSVVMCLPEKLPWPRTMREVLGGLLDRKFSGMRAVEEVDAAKITVTPQKYVMHNFCSNKTGFRPYSDEAYAEFLATSKGIALNDTCLWIRNAADEQVASWFAFIAAYHGFLGGKRGGTFLLEVGADFKAQVTPGIEVRAFDRQISDYDYFAFGILVAAAGGEKSTLMKQYLAELITQLVKRNVELGAACMRDTDEFLSNPREVFKAILAEEGVAAEMSDDEIDQAIWVTQLKLIFPLLEDFRREVLLKNYYDAISSALPCSSGWNERIETPEQAELGTLVYLVNLRKLWFNKPDWDKLVYYRDVRNKLAHLEILPLDEVRRVFGEA